MFKLVHEESFLLRCAQVVKERRGRVKEMRLENAIPVLL